MAAGTLVIQEITKAGLSLTEELVEPTATDGDTFTNDGKTFLYVENGAVGDITVTIDCPHVVDGLTLADRVVTVKGTGDADGLDKQLIGPFTAIFNQSGGTVLATCSAVTDVLIGAFRLANP